MQAFNIKELINKFAQEGYLEFIRVDSLSFGLYNLPAGSIDKQQPHTEDEIYYVVSGLAKIRVADDDQDVESGSIVFVSALTPHYFHSITEDLKVLVFFAPAEYSLRQTEK